MRSRAEQPSFGADASVGYGLSVISGMGSLTDVMVRSSFASTASHMTAPTKALGLGLWGQMTVKPTPSVETTSALGETAESTQSCRHSAVLRHDPEAPISGTFGVGFGRFEMVRMTRPVALPAFTLEGGGRTNSEVMSSST